MLAVLLGCGACSTQIHEAPIGRIYQTHVKADEQPVVAESGYQLWLHDETKTIRCIIFINQRGAGKRLFFKDQRWRDLAKNQDAVILYGEFEARGVRDNGYGDSILRACEQFSEQLGRPELKHAPFVLWGHSMGGRVAQDFVRFKPERVLAFVIAMRAHPSEPDMMVEEPTAMQVPALYVMGSEDGKPKDIAAHYRLARQNGSPRAWVWVPGQEHWPKGMGHGRDQTTASDWDQWTAHQVVLPWIEALFDLRLSREADPRIGPVHLTPLDLKGGWFGMLQTVEISGYASRLSCNPAYSWFPNQSVAEQWRSLQRSD